MPVLSLSFVVFLGRESRRRSRVGYGDTAVNRGRKKKEKVNDIVGIPHPCLELFVVQRVWSWLGAGRDGGRDEGESNVGHGGLEEGCSRAARRQRGGSGAGAPLGSGLLSGACMKTGLSGSTAADPLRCGTACVCLKQPQKFPPRRSLPCV